MTRYAVPSAVTAANPLPAVVPVPDGLIRATDEPGCEKAAIASETIASRRAASSARDCKPSAQTPTTARTSTAATAAPHDVHAGGCQAERPAGNVERSANTGR